MCVPTSACRRIGSWDAIVTCASGTERVDNDDQRAQSSENRPLRTYMARRGLVHRGSARAIGTGYDVGAPRRTRRYAWTHRNTATTTIATCASRPTNPMSGTNNSTSVAATNATRNAMPALVAFAASRATNASSLRARQPYEPRNHRPDDRSEVGEARERGVRAVERRVAHAHTLAGQRPSHGRIGTHMQSSSASLEGR